MTHPTHHPNPGNVYICFAEMKLLPVKHPLVPRGSEWILLFIVVLVLSKCNPVVQIENFDSGSWKQALHGLDAGRYVLRVDEIDADGNVTSRVESPFQREYPEDVREAKAANNTTFTVQPGNSLWVIATGRYGDGLQYHQIFSANKDQIRDPDLIYPGQVFAMPE